MQNTKIDAIMEYYNLLILDDDYAYLRWTEYRKRFTQKTANTFFIGVMLDQGQLADRAWDEARYFTNTYFNKGENMWVEILQTHHATIKQICQKGSSTKKAFAPNFNYNKFHKNLRSAAKIIVDDYDSDVRNIWKVSTKDVSLIYDRFIAFQGIGDALAKMAQFILVRNYGVAGGRTNQGKLQIKPDILVRRVLSRLGLTKSEKIGAVITTVNDFSLDSPADFDAAAWVIGREFCFKSEPNCHECPLRTVCDYNNC